MSSLLDDLRAIVGEAHVLTGDGEALVAWERDWRKRYRGRALCVVLPGTADEVAAVVRRCAREDGVSIVTQGGNTGLVGGGVPDDSRTQVVLSTKRLRAIRRVDADNQTITVEAGLALQKVQAAAAEAGLLFPLSLAAEGTCTIGGNLATNAGGTQVLRFGNARELCLGLEVVTAQGELWSSLHGLRKDNTGYDLRDLFVGSEGTLGIITAATLRLFPQPRAGVTAWATCRTLAGAVALMRRLRDAFDAELVGYEAMNAASLALVERHFSALRVPLPLADASGQPLWSVLIDLASPHDEHVLRERAEATLMSAIEGGEAVDIAVTRNELQARTLWQLREAIPLAQGVEGLNIKHDVAVPLSSLAGFVAAADAALEAVVPGARHVTFGHLGDGNLHYNLQAAEGNEAASFLASHEDAANACVYDVVARFGGTFSAEHGIGRLRRPEMAARKPAPALAMMRAVKSALDPRGLLNPGVLLPD
ncbi:FAD-binding oxidoreductase [Scleromatobacter humisilvae]|uniref:FAD-binding oxidoreductase n=1 Tax=Scleromatobacter humisilvae TaxID=2897159 RepID=A0A9X2BZ50_9BURK|nr:FAD-binding oxidoreductase [Scleromatobacter humisilvae]MCK9685967.1 FAD-binding oxidoreductase [Scleromatobacter humisilvae]